MKTKNLVVEKRLFPVYCLALDSVIKRKYIVQSAWREHDTHHLNFYLFMENSQLKGIHTKRDQDHSKLKSNPRVRYDIGGYTQNILEILSSQDVCFSH